MSSGGWGSVIGRLVVGELCLRGSLGVDGFGRGLTTFSVGAASSGSLTGIGRVLPVVRRCFKGSVGLTHVGLVTCVLRTLYIIRAIDLRGLTSTVPASIRHSSGLHHVRQFVTGCTLGLSLITVVVFSLLPIGGNLILDVSHAG